MPAPEEINAKEKEALYARAQKRDAQLVSHAQPIETKLVHGRIEAQPDGDLIGHLPQKTKAPDVTGLERFVYCNVK